MNAACDVCSRPTSWLEGTSYTADEFRGLVARGFEPDDVIARQAALHGITRDFAVRQWKDDLVVRSTTGWLLCPTCAARATRYGPKPAGPAREDRSRSESFEPVILPPTAASPSSPATTAVEPGRGTAATLTAPAPTAEPVPSPAPAIDAAQRATALTLEAVTALEANVTIAPGMMSALSGPDSPVGLAADRLGDAQRLRPDDVRLHYAWASALAVAAQWQTARAEMDRLLVDHPDFHPARSAVDGWERWTPLFGLPPWGPAVTSPHPSILRRVTRTLLVATRDGLEPRATLFIRDAAGDLSADAVAGARVDLATVISPVAATPQLVVLYARIWDQPTSPFRIEQLGMPFQPRGNVDRMAYELLGGQADLDVVVLSATGSVLLNRRLVIPPGMRATLERLLAMLTANDGAEYSDAQVISSARLHTSSFDLSQVPFEPAGPLSGPTSASPSAAPSAATTAAPTPAPTVPPAIVATLSPAAFCPWCGAPRGAADRFCGQCGTDLAATAPPDRVGSTTLAPWPAPGAAAAWGQPVVVSRPRTKGPSSATRGLLVLAGLALAIGGGALVLSQVRLPDFAGSPSTPDVSVIQAEAAICAPAVQGVTNYRYYQTISDPDPIVAATLRLTAASALGSYAAMVSEALAQAPTGIDPGIRTSAQAISALLPLDGSDPAAVTALGDAITRLNAGCASR